MDGHKFKMTTPNSKNGCFRPESEAKWTNLVEMKIFMTVHFQICSLLTTSYFMTARFVFSIQTLKTQDFQIWVNCDHGKILKRECRVSEAVF